jgi:hypothetical protein
MGKKDCESGRVKDCMKLRNYKLINAFKVNDSYIIGIYEGSLSKYDIVIKYRQRLKDGSWSNIRTPKHIHWAVDLLMKMQAEPQKTKEFLSFLLKKWEEVEPIRSEEERKQRTDPNYLLNKYRKEFENYKELSKKGEYSIKFLLLLAELLMTQEKTNMEDAYMFEELLKALKSGEDIFKIVSIATHRRR